LPRNNPRQGSFEESGGKRVREFEHDARQYLVKELVGLAIGVDLCASAGYRAENPERRYSEDTGEAETGSAGE
jgi:hypothetical protein